MNQQRRREGKGGQGSKILESRNCCRENVDINHAREEIEVMEAFYNLQNEHPHSYCTTFPRHYNKMPPTNINTLRNSRPSFLIDDVRFWMLFSNVGACTFTTPQTWHNRVWNNALKMRIECQPNLCHSLAILRVFRTTPPHLRKAVPQASGDSKTTHDKMLNIVLGPFIQKKQEEERREKREERKQKIEGKYYIYIYIYIYIF